MSEKRMPVEQRLGGWMPPAVGPVELTTAEQQRMWQRGIARRRRRQALAAGVAACAVLAITVPLATGLVSPGQEQVASTTYDEYWPAELPLVLGGVPLDADATTEVLRPGPVLAVAEAFPDEAAMTGEDAGDQRPASLWALSRNGTEFGVLDVPDFGSMPALSPNGTKIAYWRVAAAGEDDETLVVVDLAGGERREQQVAANGGVTPESLRWADESTLISTHGLGPDEGQSVWAWDLDANRGVVPWGEPGAVNPMPTLLDSAELVIRNGEKGWTLVDAAGESPRMGVNAEIARSVAPQGQWVVVSREGVAVESGPDEARNGASKATRPQQIRVSRVAAVPPGDAAYGVPAESVLLDANHAIRGYVGFNGDDAVAWGETAQGTENAFDGLLLVDTETGRSTEWVKTAPRDGERAAMWQFAAAELGNAVLVEGEGSGEVAGSEAPSWAAPVTWGLAGIACVGLVVLWVRRRRARI